ncbi:uncharacterized protein RSE6_01492 [Rhynchosporium secalis]|uniref:Uncharacterized protein n=1 Tax=Rhynchosporium secalis TaxID=38038 RepID=A0A1E1LXZ7_RHYSE|nr:uncharacterized protein RSE6_01492 [Rhynchosporium secalis]
MAFKRSVRGGKASPQWDRGIFHALPTLQLSTKRREFGILGSRIRAPELVNKHFQYTRDYKALWAMTLVGTVSTFAALALDIKTEMMTTKQGKYALSEDDKHALRSNELKNMRVKSARYELPEE